MDNTFHRQTKFIETTIYKTQQIFKTKHSWRQVYELVSPKIATLLQMSSLRVFLSMKMVAMNCIKAYKSIELDEHIKRDSTLEKQ